MSWVEQSASAVLFVQADWRRLSCPKTPVRCFLELWVRSSSSEILSPRKFFCDSPVKGVNLASSWRDPLLIGDFTFSLLKARLRGETKELKLLWLSVLKSGF